MIKIARESSVKIQMLSWLNHVKRVWQEEEDESEEMRDDHTRMDRSNGVRNDSKKSRDVVTKLSEHTSLPMQIIKKWRRQLQ